MAPSIIDIPPEITEQALVFSDPRDVASFSQTCSTFFNLVYRSSDQHLWRKLFLEQSFDHLQRIYNPDGLLLPPHHRLEWRQELQRRIYSDRILRKPNPTPTEIKEAIRIVLDILKSSPSYQDKSQRSADIIWTNSLIKKEFYSHIYKPEMISFYGHDLLQNFAQIWCLIGWRDNVLHKSANDLRDTRNTARAFVYDMRHYKRNTNWGPYLPGKDPRGLCPINWEHVKWIITVMYNNLLDLGSLWTDTRPSAGLDAIRAYSAPGSQNRDPRDWAGVEGTWRRYVCFMDYRDLFTYNFSANAYSRGFFEDTDFQEATRLIELNFSIIRIGDTRITRTSSSSLISSPTPPHSPAASDLSGSDSTASQVTANVSNNATSEEVYLDERFPPIHFKGRSRGGNGNESTIRGRVYRTTDGCIRWRFASIYDGHTQWSSEGVQIGNVCSAAGIVGSWTGANHENGDPAGPYWLWKVDNDHPSHLHDR